VKTRDLTPLVDLARERRAGPVRKSRPTYVDLLPPCNAACSAGENIQAWLALASAGNDRAAWEIIVADNPFPAVHGRVCYHPCETACNREELDSAVRIHEVERFLGDRALDEGWALPGAGRSSNTTRVLVVGAGPSGLSAAYHLARLGHAVEIKEAGPQPGGMLHFGIPAYRLPRAVLMQEIARLEPLGVRITCNSKVDDLVTALRSGGFDAVFLAVGAHLSKHIDIPGRDAARVYEAVAMLRDTEGGEPPLLGRRVIVYGGGNTAMDAARTARRLGATQTMIVYRRDREHMPAHAFEADEAIAEGVAIKWLTSIKNLDGSQVTVERMELDADGRARPTGTFETLEADAVVLALGQESDTSFLRDVPGVAFGVDGTVVVDDTMMTGHPGVFAGGDMAPTERTVTAAVGHGKKAARAIDAWLHGASLVAAAKHPVVTFAMLHVPIHVAVAPAEGARLDAPERVAGFDEVVAGIDAAHALREARRCLSCGNCFECDQCLAACPEDAIVKLGPGNRYRYDYDRCTGCADCFEQCPVHAIEMVAEPATVGSP
jgi:formate dehydrogenase beta subunit